jgi:glycosyltransferase involved in cell wall biosynthesis
VRIALTHAFCWPEVRRGAERFMPALGAALVRRGHEVVHYSSAWDAGNDIVDGVETVRLRRILRDDSRHEADFGRRLFPRLVLGRFDAVHSMGRRDALASIRAARFHPGRRTVLTDLGFPNRAWWEEVMGRREARVVEKVIAGISTYSAMSKLAVSHLEVNYGRADGVVVPGGVDLGQFSPAHAREPDPTILFSGAITEPRKRVSVLLEALPLIAQAEPGVQLWLSGPGDPGELLAKAPAEARERTHALGLGEAERQHERYGRAWVTALPSIWDSFGMALIESLACGTPLVTSTHGAPQELVSEGVTGELCEPDDPEDLARTCLRAFELSRAPETVEACRLSAERFDWDKGLAPLCEALYAGVAQESPEAVPVSRVGS